MVMRNDHDSIFDHVSPGELAEVVRVFLPRGSSTLDPTAPETLESAVYLLCRMAREHQGDELGAVAKRVADQLHLGVPAMVVHRSRAVLLTRLAELA